jgi:hypothetical protein
MSSCIPLLAIRSISNLIVRISFEVILPGFDRQEDKHGFTCPEQHKQREVSTRCDQDSKRYEIQDRGPGNSPCSLRVWFFWLTIHLMLNPINQRPASAIVSIRLAAKFVFYVFRRLHLKCDTAGKRHPERSELGALSAVATTDLLAFWFICLLLCLFSFHNAHS